MMTRTQKTLLLICGVLLLGLLVLGGIQSIAHRGKVRVQIIVLPEDSALTIDGQSTKPGKIYLAKGEHTLKASRQGFRDVEKHINTNDLNPKEPIYLMPIPESQEALDWLSQHPEAQARRESAGANEAKNISQDLSTRYPFLSKLPHITTDYRIDYTLSEDNKDLALIVTLMPVANPYTSPNDYRAELERYTQEAEAYLKEIGVGSNVPVTYTPSN